MSFINKDFATSSDYTMDNVTLLNGSAVLSRLNDPQSYVEDFADDTGFTLDGDAEITGGVLQQKDFFISPLFNALYLVNGLTADYAAGLAGVTNNVGSTAVDGNGAAVFLGGQYIDYSPTSNVPGQVGTVNLVIERTYSGGAELHSYFIQCLTVGSGLGAVNIYHETSPGRLYIESYTSAGAVIDSFNTSFDPALGSINEIEYAWDYNVGTTYLFINGTLITARTGKTGSRGTIGLFRVGANQHGSRLTKAKIHSITFWNTIQHTTSYTRKHADYYNYFYKEAIIALPAVSYATAINGFKALTAFTATTETNSPRYTIGGYYWNGAAWAATNNTYATASSAADLNANLATYPDFAGETSLIIKAFFQKSNVKASVSQIDLDYYGEVYETTGTLVIDEEMQCEHFSYIDAQKTEPTGTSLTFALYVDGSLKYWDGTAWVASDGSLAQTNDVSLLNEKADDLLTSPGVVKIYLLFTTTDNSKSASIDNLIGVYHGAEVVTDVSTAMVYGYCKTADGEPISGATVTIKTKVDDTLEYIEAGGAIIEKEDLTATTDADGYWSIRLIRTSQFDVPTFYELEIETTNKKSSKYKDGKTLRFKVPDFSEIGDSQNITDLLERIY